MPTTTMIITKKKSLWDMYIDQVYCAIGVCFVGAVIHFNMFGFTQNNAWTTCNTVDKFMLFNGNCQSDILTRIMAIMLCIPGCIIGGFTWPLMLGIDKFAAMMFIRNVYRALYINWTT